MAQNTESAAGGSKSERLDDVANRVALRSLVDAYAKYMDAGDVNGVASLFCEDGRLVSHLWRSEADPPLVRQGREQITESVRMGLGRYESATHSVGGHLVDQAAISDDETLRAQGEATGIAYYVYSADDGKHLLAMAVRYKDKYVNRNGQWLFEERGLWSDWRDDRPLLVRQPA